MSSRRLVWLIIILSALAIYFPINRFAQGGVQLILPADYLIPLVPPAIVPYLLGNLLFVALPIWAARNVMEIEFETYVISILLATAVAYATYLVFPTFVTRPEIVSQDFLSRAIAMLYEVDQLHNAAPSGHTFYTLLSFLYLRRWKRRFQPVWLILTILILASTLLTRQHYVLDVVCGLALGIVAYTAGILAGRKWKPRFAT